MTDQTWSFASQGQSSPSSTTDVARDQAANVGRTVSEAGGHVAQTASDQAKVVVAETTRQARDLLGEAGGQARDQAAVQQRQAAHQLRNVADELEEMAAKGGQSGVATEVARQAADRMHGAASWLEQREPADLVQAVRDFARRRPGTFLLGAAVAGLAAGRLTKGLTAASGSGSQAEPQPQAQIPAEPQPQAQVPAEIPPATWDPSVADQADPTEAPPIPGYLETPAAPEYPATQEYPAGPEYPATSEYPAGPEYPATSEYPASGTYDPAVDAIPGDGTPVFDETAADTGYPSDFDTGRERTGQEYPQDSPGSYQPGQP